MALAAEVNDTDCADSPGAIDLDSNVFKPTFAFFAVESPVFPATFREKTGENAHFLRAKFRYVSCIPAFFFDNHPSAEIASWRFV